MLLLDLILLFFPSFSLFLSEDIDDNFMTSRIKDASGKNLMKLFYDVNLNYYGSDLAYYYNKNTVNKLGVPMYWYEQSDGNGDWTDFVDWLYFFSNNTADVDFYSDVENRIDVKSLLKQMVVESFMLASDNLASGANYYTYHNCDDKNLWSLIEFDFDECFKFDPITKLAEEMTENVFEFFDDDDVEERNPVVMRILNYQSYNETYQNYYRTFLTKVFGSESKQQPQARYAQMMQLLLPWVARDKIWQLSFGVTPSQWVLDAELSIEMLGARYQTVSEQLI